MAHGWGKEKTAVQSREEALERGQKTRERDPRKVRACRRMWDDEEWQLHGKYHTVEDAQKSIRTHVKKTRSVPTLKWQIDGVDFLPQ